MSPKPRETKRARELPHERRGKITYKLAEWDARSFCFRDGKIAFESEASAKSAAKKPGRYRVSEIIAGSGRPRRDLEPFEI